MVLENSASWEPGHDISEHSELMPEIARGVPLIKVLGIGGGGSNAVARMYKDKLPVVEYYAVNTDAQHLFRCDVGHRLAGLPVTLISQGSFLPESLTGRRTRPHPASTTSLSGREQRNHPAEITNGNTLGP